MRGLYKREQAPMSLHARIRFINFARTLNENRPFLIGEGGRSQSGLRELLLGSVFLLK